jgi:mRNA-degrading endonuclease HigB of HigAB toxin-antitoxin module
MKKNILFLIFTLFIISGCSSKGKPLRYDGVYKILEGKGRVNYVQIVDESHFKSLRSHYGTEEQAIKILSNTEINKSRYYNKPHAMDYGTRSGSLVGSARIRRNPDGSFQNSFFLVVKNGKVTGRIDHRNLMKTNLYSISGIKILKDNFDAITPFTDKLFVTNNLGFYGLRNIEGNSVLDEKFDFIGKPSGEFAKIGANGKWGFINKEGKIVVEINYDNVDKFVDEIAPVKVGNLWFFIGKNGKKINSSSFYKVGDYFTKRFIPVKIHNRAPWTFFNAETGTMLKVVAPYYSSYKDLKLIVIGDYKKYLLINTEGKPVLPYYFSRISPVDKNRFIVKAGVKSGIVDLKMKRLSKFIYDDIREMTNPSKSKPFFSIKIDRDEGVIDYDGNVIVNPGRGSVSQLSANVFKRYFFNEKMNTEAVIFKTDSKKPFFSAEGFKRIFDDFYAFEINDKWGVIDINGKIIIEAKYNKISAGKQNQFIVKKDNEYGVIDLKGDIIFDIEYKSISHKKNTYIMSQKNSSYLYKNSMKEFKDFGIIEISNENIIGVKKSKDSWGTGVMDFNGKTIVPFKYHWVSYDKILNHFIVQRY